MTWLRQRDSVTCGPSVAVMAGALLDAEYGAPLNSDGAQRWFDSEQGRAVEADGAWTAVGDPMDAALHAFSNRMGMPVTDSPAIARRAT